MVDAGAGQSETPAVHIAGSLQTPASMTPSELPADEAGPAPTSAPLPAIGMPNITVTMQGANDTHYAPIASYTSGTSGWKAWMGSGLVLGPILAACLMIW